MDTRHADQALTALGARKTQWARLPIRDKIGYLKQIQQLALTHAQRWADAGDQGQAAHARVAAGRRRGLDRRPVRPGGLAHRLDADPRGAGRRR